MSDEPYLFRIQRKSDKLWYGKKGKRWHDGHWHPENGQFYTLRALRQVLTDERLRAEGIGIVKYQTHVISIFESADEFEFVEGSRGLPD